MCLLMDLPPGELPVFDIQSVDAKSAQVAKLITVQMALEKYADFHLTFLLTVNM